jgi:hypothetical protein
MAFRMTRPTIQGTEYHKASVLKARAETVTQTRTAADPTLVAAGSELGKSYVPKAIDFTIKPAEIKIPEGDGKKKKPVVVEEKTKVEPKVGAKVEPKVEPKVEATKLDSKTIKQLPTKVAIEKLLEGTGSVDNYIYQQGRFEKAAEKFGYDISTPEGYKEAEDVMEYNDSTDTWINPRISVGEVEKRDPVENIIVGTPASITLDEEVDEEVAKKNAEIQAEIEAREALKLQKANEKAAALQLIKDQKAEQIRIHNEEVVARNEARHKEYNAALEFHGIPVGGKLNQTQLDEYRNMRILQEQNEAKYQQNPIEIEEESDPDFIQKPTQVEPDVKPTTTTTSQATQNVTNTKPKLSDFKDGKNAFGGFVSKNQAYNEAMRKWRRENPNPIQMRDDAIYKNAIKDGIVQRNMIKSGYKPLD